jgi:uncharacterized ion transporter superfamily protein YfcC
MKIKFPDTLTIVFSILVLFAMGTWLVPAGQYDRGWDYRLGSATQALLQQDSVLAKYSVVFGQAASRHFGSERELDAYFGSKLGKDWPAVKPRLEPILRGRELVVPGTYHRVAAEPQSVAALLMAPIRGFEKAAAIIAFVFLVGGAFGVLTRTGAIELGLERLIVLGAHHPRFQGLLIPLLMVLFSLAGATFGMSEEVLVFILITIPMAKALGYDTFVGVSIPFLGAGAGFAGAFSNPFTVGIAQGIANIPIFSGWQYRLFVWCVFTVVTITYVMWYARKTQIARAVVDVLPEGLGQKFGFSHRLTLVALATSLVLLVLGVSLWDWYIQEIAGLFVGLGLVSALLCRLPSAQTSAAFLKGAADMIMAAVVIAFTNGMLVLVTDGKIIDTLLYAMAQGLEGVSPMVSAQLMFVFQGVLNFFMPSGSGQAALTMPIMAPLSDLIQVSRQTAVLAFQLGDGLFNMIIPTSGVTMGVLAIAGIPFEKWFRWMLPLSIAYFVLALLLLVPPTLGWVHF